jgi:DNA-binding beta-propeller fold protein YncE
MTKKRNWLGTLVLLAAFAVVAVGCEQIMGLLGFGDEEEPIVPAGTNGNSIVEVSTFAEGVTFNKPYGVAVDKNGNVYVAEEYGNCIRMITPQGEVSTIAGNGEVNYPHGVAVDSKGNVYVADTYNGNGRICKIIPQNGEDKVIIIAGSGNWGFKDGDGTEAKFNGINDVAVDRDGNVYVADQSNHRIRKIDTDGKVSTLAGSSQATIEDGILEGPGTEAKFSFPHSVAVDGAGYVYVADTGDHRICKISPTGDVITLAGSNNFEPGRLSKGDELNGPGKEAKFDSPNGVAVDFEGKNVYVADTMNNLIRKITITTP